MEVTKRAAAGWDLVQPFILESSGIRGRILRLGRLADDIISRHAYPEALGGMLGEMLALAGALASLLKYEGVFTLQTKGDGPVGMMVVDVTSSGTLRGYAAHDAARLAPLLQDKIPRDSDFAAVPKLLGKGYLAFTVDQGTHSERYQGIVELLGDNLAECLQHYFLQSEQVQSGIVLASGRVEGAWRAGALVLQRLPEEAEARNLGIEDEDAWRRAMILQSSCTTGELLDPALATNDLLFRLFHEEGVRVFEPRRLAAGCRCSRERLVEVLSSLPRDEVMDLKEDGAVVVTCEFCRKDYRFDDNELQRIFTA